MSTLTVAQVKKTYSFAVTALVSAVLAGAAGMAVASLLDNEQEAKVEVVAENQADKLTDDKIRAHVQAVTMADAQNMANLILEAEKNKVAAQYQEIVDADVQKQESRSEEVNLPFFGLKVEDFKPGVKFAIPSGLETKEYNPEIEGLPTWTSVKLLPILNKFGKPAYNLETGKAMEAVPQLFVNSVGRAVNNDVESYYFNLPVSNGVVQVVVKISEDGNYSNLIEDTMLKSCASGYAITPINAYSAAPQNSAEIVGKEILQSIALNEYGLDYKSKQYSSDVPTIITEWLIFNNVVLSCVPSSHLVSEVIQN